MLGLVSEHSHSERATDSATEYYVEEESLLGNAPFVLLCLLFIYAHRREGYKVDCQQINWNKNHNGLPCFDNEMITRKAALIKLCI